MMMIEFLSDPAPEINRAACTWFYRSADQMLRIIEPLLEVLLESLSCIEEPSLTFVPFYSKPFNADQICYCFKQLTSIFDLGGLAVLETINLRYINAVIFERLYNNLPLKYRLMGDASSCSLIFAIILTSIPYACAECTSDEFTSLRSKVEATQIAAQRMIILAIDNYERASYSDLGAIYQVFVQKLRYFVQCKTFGGLSLTIKVIDSILKRMIEVNGNVLNDISRLDVTDLGIVIQENLTSTDSSEVVLSWTEFICNAMISNYFDDCLNALVQPECKVLLKRIHDDIQTSSGRISEATFTAISCLVDIFSIAMGAKPSQQQQPPSTSLIRSSSAQSFPAMPARPSLSGLVGAAISNCDLELKLNPVSSLIPLLVVEIGHLSKDKDIKFFREKIIKMAQRIYRSSPVTTMYTIADYIGVQLDATSETELLIRTPILDFFSHRLGPLHVDLLRVMGFLYRNLKDSKNEIYSKLYFGFDFC